MIRPSSPSGSESEAKKPDSGIVPTLIEILRQELQRGKEGGVDIFLKPALDPDNAERLNRLVKEVILRQRHEQQLVELHQRGVQFEFKRALDIQTRIVANPDHAELLATRHNAHLITRTFIENVEGYAATGKVQYKNRLMVLGEQANRDGFFILPYTSRKLRRRITTYYQQPTGEPCHPCYLIAEAAGRHPNPETGKLHAAPGFWAADCQFHLPMPGADAESVVELPGDNDHIEDQGLAQIVRKQPFVVASLDDIVSMKKMSNLCLAPAAMTRGIEEILQKINPVRGEFPIQYIGAAIASLQGIVLPDGTEIRLGMGGLEDIPPIMNQRSWIVFEHFRSALCTNYRLAYILKGRKYPFYLSRENQGSPYYLIVNWYEVVSHLQTP